MLLYLQVLDLQKLIIMNSDESYINDYLRHPDENVMIDIETLNEGPNAVILYIAAIQFNIQTEEILFTTKIPVSIDSCLRNGMEVNERTIEWWFKNDSKVIQEVILNDSKVNIEDALRRLNTFIAQCSYASNCNINDLYIWANSPRFDLGRLQNAYYKVFYDDVPWSIRMERDVRTIAGFNDGLKQTMKRLHRENNREHDPIEDCRMQIQLISRILNDIKYG